MGKVIAGTLKREWHNQQNKTLRRNLSCENLAVMTKRQKKSEEFPTLGLFPG